MTREEQERLFSLVADPPAGSKIEAAKKYGVDLSLLLHSLSLTPDERVREAENALQFAESLRAATDQSMITNFEAALRVLADAEVNFIIVGAYAAYVHGANQLTRDLDLCYERTAGNMKRLAAALAPLHPRLRGAPEDIPFTLDERALAMGTNFTLQTDLGDLDLLGELSGVGRFSELAQDAVTVNLHGRTFRVASLDAIIRSKKAAGRPKDLNSLPELEAIRQAQSEHKHPKGRS